MTGEPVVKVNSLARWFRRAAQTLRTRARPAMGLSLLMLALASPAAQAVDLTPTAVGSTGPMPALLNTNFGCAAPNSSGGYPGQAHGVSVLNDGVISTGGGFCPLDPINPAFTITLNFAPAANQALTALKIYGNSGNFYTDSELQLAAIDIDYVDPVLGPKTLSLPQQFIGNTQGVNAPAVFPIVVNGVQQYLYGVTQIRLSQLAPGTGATGYTPNPGAEAAIREITGTFETGDPVTVKTVTSGAGPVAVGGTVTFAVTVRNAGTAGLWPDLTLTDLLPPGLTATAGNGAVTQGTYNTGTGQWLIGSIAPGATATLTLTGTVKPNPPGSITNTTTAALGSRHSLSTAGDVPTASVTTSARPPVAGNDSLGGLVPGTAATLNPLSNDSDPDGTLDPASVVFTSAGATAGGKTLVVAGEGTWTINPLTGAITFTPAPGFLGDPTPVTYTVADNEGNVSNPATVTLDYVPQADLAITKTVSNAAPNVGSNVTFTLTVTNNGPSPATGVSVADLLPAGYVYVSDTSGGAYNAATGAWTIGTLAGGASTSLDVTATVQPSGSYANTATVSGAELDPVPGNNTDTSTPAPVSVTDLSVAKSVSNGTPTVGSNVTFTILVTNNGPSNATGVSVSDLLPSGYSYVSDNAAGSYDPATGIWVIGPMASGMHTTLDVVATVLASGSYGNTATVSGNESDPAPGNNSDTATVAAVASTDLAITKSVNNALPLTGDTIVFTLTASNNGPSDATGVIVSDPLPNGFVYVSDNSGGGYNAATGVWTIGSLANGTSATLAITVTVAAGGQYLNTAVISGAEIDPNPINNAASVAPGPLPRADLYVTKTVNNPTANVGTNVIFTLTVGNHGLSTGTGVTVTDLLPSGYTYVSDTSGGAYNAATGVWTVGSLLAATTAAIDITATVNPIGNYTNGATVTGNEPDFDFTNNSSIATVGPVPQADVEVVKTVSSNTPNVGSNVIFTVAVKNNGPSGATGVSVADLLPAGYTYVSDSGPGTYNPGTGLWTIGTLASGGTATMKVVATVNPAGPYLNTATVSAAEADPVLANNTSSIGTAPVAQSDLAVTKTASSNTPNVGTTVTFTLLAANNGPSDATGVSVTDTLPSGYTYVSDTGGGAYNAGTGLWSIGNLASGTTATLDIAAQVNAGGTYLNSASITGTEPDPDLANNTSTASPAPVAQANLVMAKSVNIASPAVGTNVAFTLTVTNSGPSDATGVLVNDLLPSGYTYVSDTSGGAYSTATALWTVGNLVNGASRSITIVATVNPTGNYTNTATAAATEADPNPGNNAASATPTPNAVSDLALTKTVDNAAPGVGANVTFTITVTNNGPSAATGIMVAEPLASGYTYVSDTSGGAYNAATGQWTIGSLANGATVSFDITATVRAGGSYSNTATVSGAGIDPVAANNSATVVTVPIGPGNLTIKKTAAFGTVMVGQIVPYTITVTNSSSVASVQSSVVDILPPGFVYKNGSGVVAGVAQDPAVNGNRLTFASVAVPPATTVTITLGAFVSSTAQPGPQTNIARALDRATGAVLSPDARATVMVMVDPVFDCGTVIGKVFDDANLDGYQNPGEHGIAGVRVVGVRGTVITTDRHGRFHVPCADLPRDIGTNFILKLDTRSLPTGYRITTENPRVARLTAGKMTELNFGAAINRIVRIDLSARAFLTGDDALKPRAELVSAIDRMINQIKDSPSVLRLSYVLDGDSEKLARKRTAAVEKIIRDRWHDRGRYRLIVEHTVRVNEKSREEE